jgi:hypothetical protein
MSADTDIQVADFLNDHLPKLQAMAEEKGTLKTCPMPASSVTLSGRWCGSLSSGWMPC